MLSLWRWRIARFAEGQDGNWCRVRMARWERGGSLRLRDARCATRVMDRARIPKRYEHCDFESYVTDLTDGKTWTAQHAQSLKQAKLLTQGFVATIPALPKKDCCSSDLRASEKRILLLPR